MADKVYFISEQYLKDNTSISMNVEPQLLNIAIQDAQNIHIQPLLGGTLYKKLCDLIVDGTIGATANEKYKTLLDDYVAPATSQWALAECLPYIRWKLMNKSVSSQQSDNTTPADLEEIKFLKAELRNKAEFYGERIVDHLKANYTLYPEYIDLTNSENMPPNGNAYFGGIQLDDVYDCDKWLGLNSRTRNI
jgi:hypothetical protein